MENTTSNNGKQLFILLDERNKKPLEKDRIDGIIAENFEKEMAIMIIDSSGFSRKTVEYGIIHFLAILKRVNDKLKPIIKNNHGKLLTEWADNFIIAFNSPEDAINAAIEMNNFIYEYNRGVTAPEKFGICIGVGYGTVLYTGNDIFGHEVNLASKLGEDIAKQGEILITENTHLFLKDKSDFTTEEIEKISVSGVSFKYYKVIYPSYKK